MTTSAPFTSLATTSRPPGLAGSSVMLRLLRFICRNSEPAPSASGAVKRSSLPSRFSMRITSAPYSASIAAQYGPAM